MEYDLGYQKPDDDESSPPPEADKQNLGEGVEADICNNASVDSQHNPPPPTDQTLDDVLADFQTTVHNFRESVRLWSVYDSVRTVRSREMNLSHAISSSRRRARNKTRWEEIRRRRDLNMKRRGESYFSASDGHYFSIGTDILLRNRFGIC